MRACVRVSFIGAHLGACRLPACLYIHSFPSTPRTRPGRRRHRVYVTMVELESLPEEQILLEWNDTSMMLTVKLEEGKERVLWIKRLYDEIADASFRKRKDKVIVTLKKKEGKAHTWFDLRKAF